MADVTLDLGKLHYLTEEALEIRRERAGKGFRYRDAQGRPVRDERTLERIKALVIPPAWTDVRIAADPNGHLQAIGRDARGRKQYLYHPEWRSLQQQHKFDKMIEFGAILPEIRARVQADMRVPGLGRQRVVATVVWLLEHTFIRVGNAEYARDNGSYGLTTLREKHVEVSGDEVRFEFKGKSGVLHQVSVAHPRVARTVRRCIELPGYELFQYVDEAGGRRQVASQDVNAYLHEIAGEAFTAKDFRTWGGTVLAAAELYAFGPCDSERAAKKNVTEAVRCVAHHLGNTVTVCRSYYVHPSIAAAYAAGQLCAHFERVYRRYRPRGHQLHKDEYATWTLLKKYSTPTAG